MYTPSALHFFYLLKATKATFSTLSWLSRSLPIHADLLEFLPNFLLDGGQGSPYVSATFSVQEGLVSVKNKIYVNVNSYNIRVQNVCDNTLTEVIFRSNVCDPGWTPGHTSICTRIQTLALIS